MNVSDIFNEISKIKYSNNKELYPKLKKHTTVDTYNKMLISDYKLESEKPLRISGEIDFFYEDKEVIDINLNRDTYKYLVYDTIGHNGEWKIIEFDDIRKVEKHILSPGGILNMFTTEIIVLENLKNKKYKVFEVLENGTKKEVFDFEDCTSDIEPTLIVEWI